MKRTSIAATSETLISILQDNLKDRYKSGFPVLKELIQNADDAGANTLRLGYAPAAPAPDGHPLLSGHALFAVNDGSFDEDDDRAILQFGISSKSDDAAAIGKFGLGMKSVFHFSEVVYYLAKCDALPGDEEKGLSKGERADRLNPWYSDDIDTPPLRARWDDFTDQQQRWLRGRLGPLLPNGQHFLLWMPLRLASHADEENPPIIHRDFDGYCGPGGVDDQIFEAGYVEQLAELLPMLHTLEMIEVWTLDAANPPRRLAAVRLRCSGSADRRCLPPDDLKKEAGGKQRLRGEIEVVESAPRPMHVFGGVTRILDTERIAQLSRSKKWPRNFRREGRSRVHVREKAPPHVGVCWRRRAAEGKAELSCSWAVYLPLSEKPEVIPVEGEWTYSLLLHGWFFVDSGRNRFWLSEAPAAGSEPADEPALRHEWNRELMDAGTLPLIPESLLELQSRAGVSADHMRQLVRGLAKTRLVDQHRAAICSTKQWGYRWRPGGASWELIERNAVFVEITDAKGGVNPVDALPGLSEVSGRLVLTPGGWPRLACQERGGAWPEQELAAVLSSAEPQRLFADPRRLEYVVEFCEQAQPGTAPMIALLRRLLERPLKDVGERQKLLERLVQRVPAKQRLSVPVKDDPAGRELWKKLESLSLTILLVPLACEPDDDAGSAVLTVDDGTTILQAIALPAGETATAAADDLRGQIAQVVLEKTALVSRPTLLKQCAKVRVFRASEAGEAKERPTVLAWEDLIARSQRGVVFRNTERSGAVSLRKVFPKEPITLLTRDLGDLLFGQNKLTACDADGCGRVILGQTDSADLADVSRRGELLDFFLKSPSPVDVAAFRRAVAVLLHSQVPAPEGQPALLVDGGAGDPIWAGITRDVLARQGEPWRLVDHGLSSKVPEDRRHEFSLSTVDRSSVIRLLEKQVGQVPDGVALSLTGVQREELLGQLHLARKPELLKRLRIHAEYVNDQPAESDPLHAITDRCYWHDGFALPPEVRPHVTPLRLSDNVILREAQKQLASVWDARAAAEVVLGRMKPADHWGILLDALGRIKTWPDEFLGKLRDAAWLPRSGAAAVCPCDVIHLEAIGETVSRALATAKTKVFIDSRDLDERVRKHANFAILATKLFPAECAALEMLGEVLGEDDAFHVGTPDGLTQPTGLNRFRAAFAKAHDDVMRAFAAIDEVDRKFGWSACVNGLLKPLRKPLSAVRLKRILAHLSRRHEQTQGSSEQQTKVLEVHGWYLRELTAQGLAFRDALTGAEPVRLLSRAGNWKTPSELCLVERNIDSSYCLDESAVLLVEPHLVPAARDAPIPGSSPASVSVTGGKAAEELAAYFKPWLDFRPGLQVVIGGFLAILGGNPPIKQLAQRYLGKNYTVANVRRRLNLPKDQYGRESEGQVDQYQVTVQRDRGTVTAVNNLCGHRITVPLSKEVEELFVYHGPASPFERTPSPPGEPKSYRVVRLREFAPAAVGDQRLIDLLRKAAGKIVAEFYNQLLGTGLDELFKGLNEDDIHQIRVAATYLLDHAPASLRQFDLSAQPRLRDLLRRMDEVHRLQAEENVVADATKAAVERRSDEQRRQVQQEFRAALDDPEVCAALLDAVRRKINGHFQYSESSVPFELLQNADDACVEFERLGGTPGDWFSVACGGGSVAFLHAGRPINVSDRGDVSLADSGFHRDLEKMLMLATSDKQTGEETSTVTGKYGLGFKSVFLISDRPHVLSRGLAFEVVGALLPHPLAQEDRQRLEERFQSITGRDVRDAQGTIFSLPLRPEAKPETILWRFRRLLPVLLAFTQRIRECHLHELFPETLTTEWAAQPLPHATGWAIGMLDSPDSASLLHRRPAAILRLGEKKALLLGLDPRGFTALPDEVPSIWVTAPTGHEEKVGVALNAPFALDVGRAQLGRDTQAHHALADELAASIGAALVHLFDAATDHWDETRRGLNLIDGATPAALWKSLWLVLGEGMAHRARHSDSEAFKLLKRIFWGGATHGLTHLYEQKPALPTGLDVGAHDVLTKHGHIARRLTGCLDAEDALTMFTLAAAWPKAKAKLAPGTVVSDSRIWEALEQLGAVDERQASPVDLEHLIGWELEADAVVPPQRAATFGAVVRAELLQRLENTSSGLPEARRLRETLKAARFRSKKGTEEPAERLLVALSENADRLDEARRAAFAPADRVLADDYQGPALDFFFSCRPALKATVEDLIAWGRAAEGEQRSKFLEYVNAGDLASPLSRALRQQTGANDWWRNAEEFREAAGRTQEIDTGFISAVVGQVPAPMPEFPFTPVDEVPAPRFDPSDVLPRLAAWWQANRSEWLRQYRDWVYPSFLHPLLTPQHALTLSLNNLSDDLEGRKRWLSLFILGMTHGLGRGGQYAQQHRGFLELCERQKWLDVFADPKVTERRADWIALVDDYLDKHQGDPEYYNWLRQLFISIRAVAVRLEDYAEAFRALRSKGPVRLSDVLRPRSSPLFGGGGVDPPSLARVLSLGACFVARRELVRGGFLPSRTQVHPFCYPPVRSVRRLLGSLADCPDLEGDHPDSWTRSEIIYSFLSEYLDDPTFGGDFDIPLWLLSRQPDLQQVILHETSALEPELDEEGW